MLEGRWKCSLVVYVVLAWGSSVECVVGNKEKFGSKCSLKSVMMIQANSITAPLMPISLANLSVSGDIFERGYGQVTHRGMVAAENAGNFIKQWYPDSFPRLIPDKIWVRSAGLPENYDTVAALLKGMEKKFSCLIPKEPLRIIYPPKHLDNWLPEEETVWKNSTSFLDTLFVIALLKPLPENVVCCNQTVKDGFYFLMDIIGIDANASDSRLQLYQALETLTVLMYEHKKVPEWYRTNFALAKYMENFLYNWLALAIRSQTGCELASSMAEKIEKIIANEDKHRSFLLSYPEVTLTSIIHMLNEVELRAIRPGFLSTLFFEVHHCDGNNRVDVYFSKGIDTRLLYYRRSPIIIPSCNNSHRCPADHFVSLLKDAQFCRPCCGGKKLP